MNETSSKSRLFLLCLALTLATLAVFGQVRHHEFVDFDDDDYIYGNTYVLSGLTREGLVYAFTSHNLGDWHPLTMLSHMLDCQLYGLNNPGAHHLTNVLFHAANAVLLFIVLNSMTGSLWSSAFVAALFALHPLHVESVAWASERKDVLSTFFWMLTMAAYLSYVRRPGIGRYLLTLLAFVLGLMAKPMLVTLPFILLLLDYWPLGRLQWGRKSKGKALPLSKMVKDGHQSSSLWYLIVEKIPLFVIAAIISVVTFLFEQSVGVVESTISYTVVYRIENALVSYVAYIVKMLWPSRLAVFYPHHSGGLPAWKVVGSALLVVFITVVVIWNIKQRPYLVVGWLWYLGTLVPVIGLVQIGLQAMADRYTYIPLTGLFVIIAWGIPDIFVRLHNREVILSFSAGVVLLALGITAFLQVEHWQNSLTLYRHAAEVIKDNWWAHHALGDALRKQGRIDQADKEFRKALQIEIDNAISRWENILRYKPDDAEANLNLGLALIWKRKFEDAIEHLNQALMAKPNWPQAYYCLGLAYDQQGKYELAIKNYNEALKLRPDYPDAVKNLEMALKKQAKINQTIRK
jgi:predicted negative regulator of RcsB-dependent stress response